ncbi:WecB/TagA/CpsF family glycosyltransferase [Trichothermofontia sp.]
MNKVKILNVELDNLSQAEMLAQLQEGVVFTPNVDHLMRLQWDRAFFNVYQDATFKVCDSKIMLYAAAFLGTPLKEKLSGSDFFPAFYTYHRDNPAIRIFLLGAAPGVAQQAQANINVKVGREIIVGAHSPSFGFEKNEAECDFLIDLVNQSGATVLAVGVGAPKQEIFIHTYRHRMPQIKIFLAIGATIDFEAGNVKRSPKWMSEIGLEWLYRLLAEPKRLWKRYLVDNPPFLWLILKQKFNAYRDPFT